MARHSFFISFLLQLSFFWPLLLNNSCRRNAVVESSQATRKRPPRTATRPAMASTCSGFQRSIYHQKKTDRHVFRHAREKPTAAPRTAASRQAATAQTTNKQQQVKRRLQQVNKLIQTFTVTSHPAHHQHHHLPITTADSNIITTTSDDGSHTLQQHLVLHPNQPLPPSASATATAKVYSSNHQLFFIYFCFLFHQIFFLNQRQSQLFIRHCFHRFLDHSKLIILIKCKCLKILFCTFVTAITPTI